MSAFLAIDWGTTNRRIYRIEDGAVVATHRDDRGVKAMAAADYPAEIASIRARFGDLPVLMAGMVGSTIGWREAAYLPLPATLHDLAEACAAVDPRTAIVPGLCDRSDVMRGEEVQLLGAHGAGLVPADALLCQPGTHCKWARMAGGAITGFTTAMTGELYDLLRRESVLAAQLSAPVTVGAAFAAGVGEGARRDLPASLFGVRARGVLGALPLADAASYASGILIGADTAARIAVGEHVHVHVLADAALGDLYCAAIRHLGGTADRIDSHAAFVAGITAIWEQRR